MTDCTHVNAYRDDFLGQWHCDDCGASLDGPPAPADPKPEQGEES